MKGAGARGVIPSEARNRALLPVRRARFLAEFTLSTQSEILRFAQDDSEGLGMTGMAVSEILQGFSAC